MQEVKEPKKIEVELQIYRSVPESFKKKSYILSDGNKYQLIHILSENTDDLKLGQFIGETIFKNTKEGYERYEKEFLPKLSDDNYETLWIMDASDFFDIIHLPPHRSQ